MFLLDPSNPLTWITIAAIIIIPTAILARSFKTTVLFVYPNAKIEAMGNPFLESSNIERLLESKTLKGFIEHLSTHRDYKVEGETTLELQESIDEILPRFIEDLKRDNSKKMQGFYDMFLQKMDSHILKKAFRDLAEGKEIQVDLKKIKSNITKQIIKDLIETEDIESTLRQHGFPVELIELIRNRTDKPLLIDAYVDRYIIDKLRETSVPHGCRKGLQEYIDRLLDIENLKLLFRAKQLKYDEETILKLFLGEGVEIPLWKYKELIQTRDIPQLISQLEGTSYYGVLKNIDFKTSVQQLTIALDKLLLKHARDISTSNYTTIGPTIRFLVSKEIEIRNLRIIAKGIGEQLPLENIKPLLIVEEK